MPNPYFQFKRFTVWHDKCAMKVGTDGVLLGAWADVSHARKILDIGAGTGLLSLMMAQRNESADITAIEMDKNAVLQAQENVARSPWKDKINVIHADFKKYVFHETFDLIVSNPPYFSDSLKSGNNQRDMARHTEELTYEDLICKSASLLNPNGLFSVVIPADVMERVISIAENNHLYSIRRTMIHTTPNAIPKRVLLAFSFQDKVCETDELTIELSRHTYTEEYIELTKDYYLKM